MCAGKIMHVEYTFNEFFNKRHLLLKYILNPYLLIIDGKFLHFLLCLKQLLLQEKKNACLLLYTQKLANIIMNVMNSTTK